jgi:hypothetical protein
MHNIIPACLVDNGPFLNQFSSRLDRRSFGAICRWCYPNRRKTKKLSAYDVVVGLVYHVLHPHGTFAAHVKRLTGITISDEALSQRRSRLPWELLERILCTVLRPLADAQQHPQAFYQGLRLVGVDGTMFSVFNTPWISKSLRKAVSRRAKAAFAKLRVCTLVELGVHNPLAVRVSRADEAELTLGYRLLEALPAQSLLLADRLYGVGKFLVAFLSRFAEGQSDFLVRVSAPLKGKLSERLADGSVVLVITGRDADGQKREILVRQICGVVSKAGRGRRTVRLWTSLLDAAQYPAGELLALYARRWEHELTYQECKVSVSGGDLLSSYTVETAMQEVAALVIGQALVAEVRLAVAHTGDVEPVRISFVKVLEELRWVWLVFARLGESLNARQQQGVVAEMYETLWDEMTAKRRGRSCPRALRQPVSSWPRKLKNQSWTGNAQYQVLCKHKGLS